MQQMRRNMSSMQPTRVQERALRCFALDRGITRLSRLLLRIQVHSLAHRHTARDCASVYIRRTAVHHHPAHLERSEISQLCLEYL